tara:strand:+ start:28 stop:177 length:150 start_codon:yes stop_codon:yes gene_type:complete
MFGEHKKKKREIKGEKGREGKGKRSERELYFFHTIIYLGLPNNLIQYLI